MSGTQEEMSGGVIDSKTRTTEHTVQRKPGHSPSYRQLSPPSTMLPLGLGSGPGLGSQNGKVNKTPPPSSSTASTNASYTEPQDWGVNARDEKGRTALHFACGMVPADCARLLLDAGADVHARDKDGYTPLHMAAGYGRWNCVKLLLDHDANIFVRERAGRTPRELAVEIRDDSNQAQEVVKVPRGDIDQTIQLLADAESKCVDNAAQGSGRKLSKMSYPAAPTSSNSNESRSIAPIEFGKSKKTLCSAALGNALTVACRGGHVDVVELLLSSGAHVDAHDPDGATPLLAAADSGFSNCVQLLLKHGANADAKDRVGVTALIAAAYNGHSDCLEVLLHYNASVDAKSHGGVTPLIAAAEGCNADCTQVLLLAGAQVNARTSEGKTALMHAVSRNCVEATESLLNGGAEINTGDGDGFTALHHGARNNSAECLRILLDKGADVTRKCRRGRTPLQEASKDSEAAKLLEERWKVLESEIAMRQMEVLNLFEQDRNIHKSNTSKKSSTRQAREKKNGRRKKEPIEKADLAKQEPPKLTSTVKTDDEPVSVDVLSSSPGSEVAMEQPSPNLVLKNEEDLAPDKSTHLSRGGGQDSATLWGLFKTGKESSSVSPLILTNAMSCSSEASAPSSTESVFDNLDEWIRVDGKRTAAVGSSLKTNASHSKPHGSAASTVSSLRPDYISTERKISGGQSIKQVQGSSKTLKEVDSKDDETSPWVQVLLRRTHSVGDGTSARPHVEVPSKTNSPLESKAEDHIWETAVEFPGDTEEKLSDRMHRVEVELQQARQAARAHMQRVKELEMLVSTPKLEKSDANLTQVIELTNSLEFQIRARLQAENAKTVLELRIRDLEAVVSSQSKALETAQAEIAELKLQMTQKEERRKQECEIQQRESIAAALAAAAGSCQAWESYHSREILRGWSPECAETAGSGFAQSLLRSASASGYKIDGHLSTLDFLRAWKQKGDQEDREESFEWKSTAAAAAIAAASVIRSKDCTCCSALNSHLSCHSHNVSGIRSVSETLSKSDSPECTFNDHEVDVKEALEDSANQEPSKTGKGIVRSASEGSLQSTGSGVDQRVQQDLLPFIPMAGPKTDPANGWFSLVPSPVD